jgi:hypothetical protein
MSDPSTGHLIVGSVARRDATNSLRESLRLHAAPAALALSSFALVFVCGVGTGLRALDKEPWAPWARSVLLIGVLAGIAVVARRASILLSRVADEREVSNGTLLRAPNEKRFWDAVVVDGVYGETSCQ